MKKVEIAKQLGISKSYLSMILKGQRRLTSELAEKLQQLPGVHKIVNPAIWKMFYTQEVRGSSPLPPTIWASVLCRHFADIFSSKQVIKALGCCFL